MLVCALLDASSDPGEAYIGGIADCEVVADLTERCRVVKGCVPDPPLAVIYETQTRGVELIFVEAKIPVSVSLVGFGSLWLEEQVVVDLPIAFDVDVAEVRAHGAALLAELTQDEREPDDGSQEGPKADPAFDVHSGILGACGHDPHANSEGRMSYRHLIVCVRRRPPCGRRSERNCGRPAQTSRGDLWRPVLLGSADVVTCDRYRCRHAGEADQCACDCLGVSFGPDSA